MGSISRRQLLALSACSATVAISGCTQNSVSETLSESAEQTKEKLDQMVEEADTEDLVNYKVALRGYAIVSMAIAGRVVLLPYPGMRILSAAVVVTAVTASLVVEYIDEELIRRKIEETLTDAERAKIESQGYVAFRTESGVEERTYLAKKQYGYQE